MKIKDIVTWYQKWDGKQIFIETENNEYKVTLSNKDIYHLLGLHYLAKPRKHGQKNLIDKLLSTLTDEEILNKIKKELPEKEKWIKDRLYNFKEFMESLEFGKVIEISNSFSKISSTTFAVQYDNRKVQLLGLKPTKDGYVFNTFIVDTHRYLKNIIAEEKIRSIKILDKNGDKERFSFLDKKTFTKDRAMINLQAKLKLDKNKSDEINQKKSEKQLNKILTK